MLSVEKNLQWISGLMVKCWNHSLQDWIKDPHSIPTITTSVQQCTKVLANPAREENENNWWNIRKNFKWNYFKWAWLCEKSEKNSTDEILELLKEFNKFESKR